MYALYSPLYSEKRSHGIEIAGCGYIRLDFISLMPVTALPHPEAFCPCGKSPLRNTVQMLRHDSELLHHFHRHINIGHAVRSLHPDVQISSAAAGGDQKGA